MCQAEPVELRHATIQKGYFEEQTWDDKPLKVPGLGSELSWAYSRSWEGVSMRTEMGRRGTWEGKL